MFHDDKAERCVLASMLVDNEVIQTVMDTLVPADFFFVRNQLIFFAMTGLYRTKVPVDLVTVVNELRLSGKLEQAGDIGYVAGLAQEVATAKNVGSHMEIVKNHSTPTAQAVPCMLDTALARGYRVVSLAELLNSGTPYEGRRILTRAGGPNAQ